MVARPRTAKKRLKKQPRALPDLSDLTIKPHWWIEMHTPVNVEGAKWPDGIHATCTHEGIRYTGVLYAEVQA